jgi:hypothetical protein
MTRLRLLSRKNRFTPPSFPSMHQPYWPDQIDSRR